MPFLLNSVLGELFENGLEPLLVVHPVIGVKRDAAGGLIAWSAELGGDGGWKRESVIDIHIARLEDETRRAAITAALGEVLNEVRLAVQDWAAMRERANEAIAALATSAPPLPCEEAAEAVEFLQWLLAANFTFLGMRAYALAGDEIAYEPDMETAGRRSASGQARWSRRSPGGGARPHAVRPRSARTIQISKHAPMNPAIR